MAKFGVSVYDQDNSVSPPNITHFGEPFLNTHSGESIVARSTGYGYVSLNWNLPNGSWSLTRLVRNSSGIPVDVEDGDTLFTDAFVGARTSYIDNTLTPGRYYYYRQFVQPILTTPVLASPDGYWLPSGSASVLATGDSGYSDTLYGRLPEWFKGPDNLNLGELGLDHQSTFLYRFLSLFGFQLDQVRADTDHLLQAYNAQTISEALLPSLGAQFGVAHEYALGSRSMRRFTDGATRIWKSKGTLPGIRELAAVVTGYGTHVRLGTNLSLSTADSGPYGGVGNWRGRTNASVSYRANLASTVTPSGDGVHVITAPTSGPCVVDLNPGESSPVTRMQYAIPVVPSLSYVASSYFSTQATGISVTAHLQWLDANGNPLGVPVDSATVVVASDWSTRVTVGGRAYFDSYVNIYSDPYVDLLQSPPPRYADVSYSISGLAPTTYVDAYSTIYDSSSWLLPTAYVDGYVNDYGSEVLQCGFALEEASAAGANQHPARETLVYLDSQVINYVGNTSGMTGSGIGWSSNVTVMADPIGAAPGQCLTIYPTSPPDLLVSLIDGDVVPGVALHDPYLPPYAVGYSPSPDVAPTEPTKVTTLQPMNYAGFMPMVNAGDVYTALATCIDPDSSLGTRTAQVGMNYFDGPDLVGTVLSDPVDLPYNVWTPLAYTLTVPRNAIYDRIELVVMAAGGVYINTGTGVKNVALVQQPAATAFAFDGATPSPTSDFLWESTPFNSISHYYHRRAPKIIRLQALLADYTPYTAPVRTVFAYRSIPDSPRALSGSDIDTALAPLPEVGVQLRARWQDKYIVGTTLTTRWRVFDLPVGANLSVRWYDKINYPAVVGTAGATITASWSDDVYFQANATLTAVWNTDEAVYVEDEEIILDTNEDSAETPEYSPFYPEYESSFGFPILDVYVDAYSGVYVAAGMYYPYYTDIYPYLIRNYEDTYEIEYD